MHMTDMILHKYTLIYMYMHESTNCVSNIRVRVHNDNVIVSDQTAKTEGCSPAIAFGFGKKRFS